jgi:hypothetical protein
MHEVDEKRELAKQASGGGEVLKGEEVYPVYDNCNKVHQVLF